MREAIKQQKNKISRRCGQLLSLQKNGTQGRVAASGDSLEATH